MIYLPLLIRISEGHIQDATESHYVIAIEQNFRKPTHKCYFRPSRTMIMASDNYADISQKGRTTSFYRNC